MFESYVESESNTGFKGFVRRHFGPVIHADIAEEGLREIGLWGVSARELDECFPEFRALRDQCRFADCSHLAEPECAVRDALAAGDVDAGRYASYQKLGEELAALEKY